MQGFNILRWSDQGLNLLAVSDLNREELEEFGNKFEAASRGNCRQCLAGARHRRLRNLRHALHPPPALERCPDAALQPEAVDRRRGIDGADAVKADAGPLEAALLQHPARGRVGDAGAGLQRVVAGR